jgi:hypothetical protein
VGGVSADRCQLQYLHPRTQTWLDCAARVAAGRELLVDGGRRAVCDEHREQVRRAQAVGVAEHLRWVDNPKPPPRGGGKKPEGQLTLEALAGEDQPCATAPAGAGTLGRLPAPSPSRQGGRACLDPPTPLPVADSLSPQVGDDKPQGARKTVRPAVMSDSSRGRQPPQEKSDICPFAVPLWYRLADGRWLCKRVACKTKACSVCGPRLRARWAAEWAHAMAGEQVYRLTVTEGDPAKLRRRKVMRGHQLAHIPAPDGRRVVYTTAPIGEPVTDRIGSLTRDFAAMPNDRRNKSMVGTWGAIVADAQADAEAKREPLGEYLGRGRRSLEQVEIVARELGLFLGRSGSDGVLVADPGDAHLEARFCALVGLVRRKEPRARAA